jgi:hypothetical protein
MITTQVLQIAQIDISRISFTYKKNTNKEKEKNDQLIFAPKLVLV